MTIPIPAPDPMPLPGPFWLLRALSLLTFYLHMVVMNFALGGGIIALVAGLRGKSDEHAARVARQFRDMLPVLVAFTITLGVAALLFVQVLYGPMLYSSSVLLGVPWMAVIPILIVGYYAFYWSALKESQGALWFAVLLLAVIGFTLTNNMTLMLTPERWLEFYKASTSGFHFNLGEATLVPRYLHMVLGAVALAGLFVVILGLRERDQQYREWLVRQGGLWFAGATMINVLVGFWFLLVLPDRVRSLFLGKSGLAAGLLGVSVLLALGAMAHLLMAANAKKGSRPAIIGIVSGFLAAALMVFIRDMVRSAYLEPYFRPETLPVAPQWSVIGLFIVLFIGGLATLYWMLVKLAAARRTVARAAAAND
jgi:hypothetical protein